MLDATTKPSSVRAEKRERSYVRPLLLLLVLGALCASDWSFLLWTKLRKS